MLSRSVKIILLGLALSLMASGALAKTIFVDASAAGTNTGTSWTNAYKFLQDAIAAAAANDEIRVAAGTYQPDQGVGITLGDRSASFVLKNLVRIVGGYPSGGGATPDWQTNQTILSGDLLANDNPATAAKDLLTDATRADNSYHVIRCELSGSPTKIDGLTIIAGQANGADTLGYGGGWYNISNSSPTIVNCVFTRNAAKVRGGGWYNNGPNCKPVVMNVAFSMNYSAESGGGVAMLNTGVGAKLDDCHFNGNYVENFGGGIYLDQSSPQILNSDFSGEYAGLSGGALVSDTGSFPTVTNTSFKNSSSLDCGAVWVNSSNIKLNNCLFSNNAATRNGGACYFGGGGQVQLDNCDFTNNQADYTGGAVFITSCDVIFNGCDFTENAASYTGGAINAFGSAPQMTQCLFYKNFSASSDGGAIYNLAGHPKLMNCKFIGNHSANHGGAITNQAYDSGYIHAYLTGWNCLFAGNYTTNGGTYGGAIANLIYGNRYTFTIFINSTFYSNTAVYCGGGFYTNNMNSTNTLQNCILYGNADTGGGNYSESAQIYYGTYKVQSSCIQGLSAYVGDGNIDADPMFANPLGDDWVPGTLDDDLRLTSGSPCVDAGKNQFAIDAGLTTDLDGLSRFVDDPATPDTGAGTLPIVDMGAYEFSPNVVFCDANLKIAVEEALGITNPKPADMLLLTSLTANSKGIQCLGGLEYALNLETLSVTGNNIADLSPLTGLTKLKNLKIASNKITDICPLSGLSELDYVWMSANKISDFCCLVDLHKLRYIYATSNAALSEETYLTCIPAIWAGNPGLIAFVYDPGCKTMSKADVNGDCHVNMLDLALVAAEWLKCNHLYDSMCP